MHTTVHTNVKFSICETKIVNKPLKRCKFWGTDPIPTELIQARGKILRFTNLLCVKVIFPEYYLGNEIKESEVGGTYLMQGIAQGYTEFPKI